MCIPTGLWRQPQSYYNNTTCLAINKLLSSNFVDDKGLNCSHTKAGMRVINQARHT